MNTTQLRQIIASGIEGLPQESLQEIADFVTLVRFRTLQPETFLTEVLRRELSILDASEMAHLEEEFADYESRFPHE